MMKNLKFNIFLKKKEKNYYILQNQCKNEYFDTLVYHF